MCSVNLTVPLQHATSTVNDAAADLLKPPTDLVEDAKP